MAAGLGLRLVAAEPFAEIGVEVGEADVASGGNDERLVHGSRKSTVATEKSN